MYFDEVYAAAAHTTTRDTYTALRSLQLFSSSESQTIFCHVEERLGGRPVLFVSPIKIPSSPGRANLSL